MPRLSKRALGIASLVLYGHPFLSCTQKVLIALDENAINYEFRSIAPDAPDGDVSSVEQQLPGTGGVDARHSLSMVVGSRKIAA